VTFGEVLKRLAAFHERVFPHRQVFYSKFEHGAPAEESALKILAASYPRALVPALVESWRISSTVRFEWFLKSAGAREAGIDTREAPSGQFNFFSPEEVLTETAFLTDLAGATSDENDLLPIARLNPNGELVALDLSTEEPTVVAVVLDLALSVVPLAASLSDWYEQRLQTYFADETLDPESEASDILSAVLECTAGPRVTWPPKKRLNW
jgi:hypothetical protein